MDRIYLAQDRDKRDLVNAFINPRFRGYAGNLLSRNINIGF